MGSPIQAVQASASGVYKWQIPEKPVGVHLDLKVIDGMLPEIMRAFGAVPKRGAETGGLLVGSMEQGPDQTTVHVKEAEFVPCLYGRGPSYLLSTDDKNAFEQAVERLRPGSSADRCAVGYFRSHTREGLALSPEDIELLDRLFPDRAHIALLIRPFASKPIQAGFFFRESGVFQEQTPLPFIFARRGLEGEESRPEKESVAVAALPEPPPVETQTIPPVTLGAEPLQVRPHQGSPRRVIPLPDEPRDHVPGPAEPLPEESPSARVDGTKGQPRRRIGWVWLPVSLALLAIGAALGFVAPRFTNVNSVNTLVGLPGEFSLDLKISQTSDALTVRWNPNSPAIRNAQSGTLEIEDGGYSKPVDLDSTHLQNGSIIYRNTSASVRFRLTVSEGARVSVTETADWP